MIRVCPLPVLPPREALRVDAEPPLAVFHAEEGEVLATDDTRAGSVESRDVLAVRRRGDEPVAVLALNQFGLFGRWRRQLTAAPVPA